MTKAAFSLEADLDEIIPPLPAEPLPYVETVIYCPVCRNEVDRHYPTLRGTLDPRYMMQAQEGKTCPHCQETLGRAGWTFTQFEIQPSDKGFGVCETCGFLVRLHRIESGDCGGCRSMAEHRRLLQEEREWDD